MGSQRTATRGRPRASKIKPGDRPQLSFRCSAALMKKLTAARNQSGRSQSQEAEYRIERSFDRQALLKEVMLLRYGERTAELLSKLGDKLSRFDVGEIDVGGAIKITAQREKGHQGYDIDIVWFPASSKTRAAK